MRREDGEYDYLVETQLEVGFESFEKVVKEAFLLEHGLVQNQDIAKHIGVDKSRISQIFKDPGTLKPETVRTLIGSFSKQKHRKRIVESWTRECFGTQLNNRGTELLGNPVTSKTVSRVDRMIRQSRLSEAAHLASEASKKTEALVLKEQLLDRAFWVNQRLDEPGKAMAVARKIVHRARTRKDPLREAAGQFFRSRVLLSLTDCKPREVAPVYELAADLLEQTKPVDQRDRKYVIGTRAMLIRARQNSTLLFMERGVIAKDEAFLEAVLGSALADTKRQDFTARYHAWQTVSRIYALLGMFFQAEEALDHAFRSGGGKNLQVYEMCGLLAGRVRFHTEDADQAVKYLRSVSDRCHKNLDKYHWRLAEWELARIENSLF